MCKFLFNPYDWKYVKFYHFWLEPLKKYFCKIYFSKNIQIILLFGLNYFNLIWILANQFLFQIINISDLHLTDSIKYKVK
jgi:hypothetical protein